MPHPSRHRARTGSVGARWLLVLGVLAVALVLTFALGILVGQRWARDGDPSARAAAEPAKKSTLASTAKRGGLVEPASERPPQEKLTFYQTLTAPLGAVPTTGKVGLGAKAESSLPRPAPERAPSERPERVPAPPSADVRQGDWSVQVGAFRDRGQAESVRKPLADAGFDAYVIAVTAQDGQPSHKVRLGAFRTREEAARVAARVRQERSLTAFVTPR